MLLTGLVLAIGLLIAVRISQNVRAGNSGVGVELTERQIDNLNKSIDPVIFKSVSERDGRLILSGTGPAETDLTLESPHESLLTFSTGPDGNWKTEFELHTEDSLQLEIIFRDAEQVRVRSDETVYRIPHPFYTGDAARSEPALIMITAPGGPTRLFQSPFRGMPAAGGLGLGPIDYDESGGVIFSGVSETSGRIRLYANDIVIGETRSEPDGRWFFIASDTLPRGAYDVRAELIVEDAILAQISLPFKRLALGESDKTPNIPVYVEYTSHRWQILRYLYGGGYQYTAVYAPNVTEDTTSE